MNENNFGTSAEDMGMNLKDLTVSPKCSKVSLINFWNTVIAKTEQRKSLFLNFKYN